MGLTILDGTGSGKELKITDDNRATTSSRSSNRSYYISRDDGLLFTFISHDATAAAGTQIFYFMNTDTSKNFYVDLIRVGGVETALWKVWFATGTAAGGSAITGANMNSTSGNIQTATTRGNDSITGLSLDRELATVRTPANTNVDIPFADTLIIGTSKAISVEYDTGTTGIAEVLMRGYYE